MGSYTPPPSSGFTGGTVPNPTTFENVVTADSGVTVNSGVAVLPTVNEDGLVVQNGVTLDILFGAFKLSDTGVDDAVGVFGSFLTKSARPAVSTATLAVTVNSFNQIRTALIQAGLINGA